MSYFPMIKSARTVRVYEFGEHSAVLLDNVRSAQTIQYFYVLLVFRGREDLPCFAVASEWSDDVSRWEPFLGAFPGDGHQNLGASVDMLDREKFASAAMSVVTERLGVPMVQQILVRERRKPWWRFWD
ncbi:MAG: hypothetical protein JWO31_769 [Phycisphaerales bacterium]|nr:hypothetical protein [Phycisphaerales bacterium]